MDTAHTIRWVQRQELNLQTLAYETSEQPLLNAEWLRVLESNQRMSQSKCDAVTAWLTRNIMTAGIQVIIEPSRPESVVPCSLRRSRRSVGIGVFPTAGNLCFKTWNSHSSSSPDEAIVQMAYLLECLYYSTLHVAFQWTFVAKLIIFCQF